MFADKIAVLYGCELPSGANNRRMIYGMMALFGFGFTWFGSSFRSLTKYADSDAEAAAGLGAMILGVMNVFVGVTRDLAFAAKVGMPASGIYANIVIGVFIALSGFSLWSASGSKVSFAFKMGNAVERAILYQSVVGTFFGVMMVFNADGMNAQYLSSGQYSAETVAWFGTLMGGWGSALMAQGIMGFCALGISHENSKLRMCRDFWIYNFAQLAMWQMFRIQNVVDGNTDDASAQVVNMVIAFVGLFLGATAYGTAMNKREETAKSK